MAFRDVLLDAASKVASPPKVKQGLAKLAQTNRRSHPMLWRAAEALAAHRYEADTGKKLDAKALGDGTFSKWLLANWDTLAPLVIKILALFGV